MTSIQVHSPVSKRSKAIAARLKQELIAREYYFDQNNAYMLESKEDLEKRGEASPDNADSLALTFAVRPGPRDPNATMDQLAGHGKSQNWDYNPYAENA